MQPPSSAKVECRLLEEFVDNAVTDPAELAALERRRQSGPLSENVRCLALGEFVDTGTSTGPKNGAQERAVLPQPPEAEDHA
jgi:hypothetical protein